ncbi:Uncharacterized protein conserved in bacteria [Shewanella baltica]|jgi:uncharacterized protein YejL (UPF0352 family)|uniref:UPF0352 protein Sbal195_2650 n=7 Tax=Shewanella TaxID=22 RepID=A9L556_SHEB9|nr:protein of unknown function DUF1414 [Shewanella baltica OS155]ABS08665.1 protein of unknown function DUF1414 [Shewanella baltica OS185]ABX49818.1 protein of unknown function DUF1414 [Shewanella baltica OS195]ACK46321.1 protein of unknown function DUF1414 [Shewanella baltica OS223]ADT94804.1 protein of unknown function DUF1414 [Shewanella baltica OS678]AEG11113.1 UPF0352 protein yejL [Shewanella baltica BA175]AEH14378.1 UPF0352 protein yejL [Shewanella baltica OS117]AUD60701.1 hypothetical
MPLIHSKVKHFLIMAIQSKYSNTQVESLIAEILAVLEKHKAPTDLSLMALGNCVTNLLERKVPSESRQAVAEQFAKALAQSVKSQ